MTYTDSILDYRETGLTLQVIAEVADGEENAYITTARTEHGSSRSVQLVLDLDELDGLIAGLIRTRTALAIELAMQERDEQEAAKAA